MQDVLHYKTAYYQISVPHTPPILVEGERNIFGKCNGGFMFFVDSLGFVTITLGLFLVIDFLTGRKGLDWLYLYLRTRSLHRPRVVVCTVNGVTGVVTRRDYERAIRKSKYENTFNRPSRPVRPWVDQTFFFKEEGYATKDFKVIGDLFDLEAFLAGCIVERGEFEIQSVSHRRDDLLQTFWSAYIYIHGLRPYRAGVSVGEDREGRKVLSVARSDGKKFTLVLPPPTSVSTLH